MSYKRMKIFNLKKELVGYLADNADDWVSHQAIIRNLDHAYEYKFVTVDGSQLRLDQSTSGGDRSLTYSSLNMNPCWGLGSNWIYLKYHDDHTISFDYRGTPLYLGRGLWEHGPKWSPLLSWVGANPDGKNFEKLVFELDEQT